MITNGLQISLVGISVVFLFLIFLIILINISARILAPLSFVEEKTKKSETDRDYELDHENVAAVISAAINMYRNRK